jgi:hypothetical protein
MTSITAIRDQSEILYVVHPIDDVPEQKRSCDGLEPMAMTPAVRGSLFTLRGYLIVIVSLALYHIVSLFATGAHHLH